MEIKVVKATTLKEKPAANALGFGKHFTDHMFVMDYSVEKDGTMQESFLMLLLNLNRPAWYSITDRQSLKV